MDPMTALHLASVTAAAEPNAGGGLGVPHAGSPAPYLMDVEAGFMGGEGSDHAPLLEFSS